MKFTCILSHVKTNLPILTRFAWQRKQKKRGEHRFIYEIFSYLDTKDVCIWVCECVTGARVWVCEYGCVYLQITTIDSFKNGKGNNNNDGHSDLHIKISGMSLLLILYKSPEICLLMVSMSFFPSCTIQTPWKRSSEHIP